MFSVSLKTFLWTLVCLSAASAHRRRRTNATAPPRTFIHFDQRYTVEPFVYNDEFQEDNNGPMNALVNQGHNVTKPSTMSQEAVLFLKGPVSTVLMPSFYTLVCLLSVPINICAVLAFARRIRPKKPAAIYMLNLACADLLFAALLPFKISYHFGGNNWIFGESMCRVVTAAFYWNMYCSVLLIACISVDRLLAVVYPINSLTWRSPRNAFLACAMMWILSFAGSVPLVLSNQTYDLAELDITTCHDVQSSNMIYHYRIYFVALTCILFFLPMVITVVSYSRVIWTLSRVPRGVPGRSRRRSRAVVMALTVLVIFLLCFTPTNCLLLAHYLQFDQNTEENQEAPDGSYALYLVFVCIGSLNCLLDPLVYYFGSSQCQRELSNTLRCQKVKSGGSSSQSSSGSQRSSSRTILKASRTESSSVNTADGKTDGFQKSLESQYKKLLV